MLIVPRAALWKWLRMTDDEAEISAVVFNALMAGDIKKPMKGLKGFPVEFLWVIHRLFFILFFPSICPVSFDLSFLSTSYLYVPSLWGLFYPQSHLVNTTHPC